MAICWIHKICKYVRKKSTFFCRVDRLGDPFEGSFSRKNVELRPNVYKEIPSAMIEQLSKLYEKHRKFMFVNCWQIGEYESAAMWKLYLQNDEGIAIQSTFKKLTDSFDTPERIFAGKVEYIDYEKDWLPEGNVFFPFVHKRKSFEYEHELRAFVDESLSGPEPFNSQLESSNVGKYIPVKLDILIEKIYISPTAPQWFSELLLLLADRFDISKEKIVFSKLSERPVF